MSDSIPSGPSQLTGTMALVEIFQQWELSTETCFLLMKYGINSIEVLKKMEMNDVNELFDKFEERFFGERIKFKAGLKQWRRKMNIPLACDDNTPSTNTRILQWLEKIAADISELRHREPAQIVQTTTSGSCFQTIDNDRLKNLLKTTVSGELVLSYYERNGVLDGKSQRSLVECIIEKYIFEKKRMTYLEMKEWANAISLLFPTEKSETYFLPRKIGKKNPTGKLFSKWVNSDKERMSVQLNGFSIQEVQRDEEFYEKKLWLQNNCSPWETVLTCWKETSLQRVEEAQKITSMSSFLMEWPRYNEFNGYELLEIDFETLYPGKGNDLFFKLESFYTKLLPIFEKEIKDPASREMCARHLQNSNLSNDTKYGVCCVLLHALLLPQRLHKTCKPTIADAQEEFVTIVTTEEDLKPHMIGSFTAGSDQLQTRIIAIGQDYSCLTDFYVYCDGLQWKCNSFMKCVDCVIKLSHIFKIQYSPKSKQVFAFLEQFFFDLKSEDFSSVANLFSKLV